ncbi:G5 domain-containing protein [Streptococcus oralis]|uniref:G5 domain-containing protein n=2 Tax=Streptococcus oralis TaxID=1303 RepID=UPI001CC113FB|nr:G5 domain-containing protein [Streptococcus oralis]MBZ2084224.1 G5 domain-containing protein [Streptococcus oralis]
MSRKKLLKLGISILALNALGVATYHVAPDLYQIPTVHAEETPAEDEEIPDGQERNIANTFKRMLNSIESSIKDFTDSPDEDNKELLEGDVEEAKNFFETAKKAMKSPEGQKSFAVLEARYNSLKAKAEALLTGGDLKEEHQEVTTTEEIPYPSRTENNADLAEGTRKVKQAGEKGQKKVVWDVTLVNGVEKKRDRKSQTVIKEPVEEIIEVGTKKTAVETKETVTVEEKVAFKEETKVDPALDKGQTRVEEGEEGIDEVTYEVTKVDGVEKSRKEVSRKTKKAAKNKVTYTGSKAVVTTKEVTKTEEVAFQTREVENALLAEGVRRVKTAGQKGVRTIVETVTYTDGVETGREVKSNTITTPAVDEIVEVGTKKVEAPVVTTKEETKTEEVTFQTKEVTNPELPEGTRVVKTAGKNGVRTIVYTVTYTDGVETGRVEKSNTITTPAVDEIVEVGTKKVEAPVVTTKEETKTEEVTFQTKEVTNSDLPEGTRVVKTAGKNGVRTIVYTVTYTDGVETGRVEKSNTITTPAVDEIVEVGTKKVEAPVVTTKEETKTEEVAFQTKEVTNPDLPEGTRIVKTAGKKGVRTIVETVTYTDGKETGREVKSNTITTPAVDEVVEIGTKKVVAPVVTTKEETKTEEVAFQTKEVTNPDLPEGSRQVKTAGKKGVRTIVETVTYTDGVETGRVEKSNTITTPAVDEVVEVGTKKVVAPVVTTKEETKTEDVAFQVKEVKNADLSEGSRQVKAAGKKGVRTIVYTVTYTDGVETGRVEKSNTITTPAVDEIVEVGTKKDTATTGNQAESTKKEETASQDQKVLPSTGTASTSLLSMIGLFIAGLVGFVVRKKD